MTTLRPAGQPCPEDVPDRFGPIARIYDAVEWGFWFFRRNPRREVAAAIPSDARRILDMGTGTGSAILTVARTHCDAELVGMDASPGMLAQAERKLERLKSRGVACADTTFVCASAADLPFDDESFDAVTGTLFFHELAPDVRARAFDEAVRVLAPGGSMVVAELDKRPEGIRAPFQWMLEAFEEDWAWQLSGDGLADELDRRGLADIVADHGIAFMQLVTGRKLELAA